MLRNVVMLLFAAVVLHNAAGFNMVMHGGGVVSRQRGRANVAHRGGRAGMHGGALRSDIQTDGDIGLGLAVASGDSGGGDHHQGE